MRFRKRSIEGFDHCTSLAALRQKWSNVTQNNPLTFPTGRRANSKALRSTHSYDALDIMLDSQPVWTLGLALYLEGYRENTLVRFYQNTTENFSIALQSNGAFALYRGWTQLGVTEQVLPLASWNFVEVRLVIDSTGNSLFEVRVNEQVWLTVAGDIQASITTCNRLVFYGNYSGIQYDDLTICDGTGPSHNTYLGDMRVDTVVPKANGTTTDFTPASGTQNWENLDDIPPDDDTTTNTSTTLGARDSFLMADLPALNSPISGVQLTVSARKDDAGTRQVGIFARVGGTDYDGTTAAPGTAFQMIRHVWAQNPSTLADWTTEDLTTAEFGYTVAG